MNIPPVSEILDAVGDSEDDSDVRDPELGLVQAGTGKFIRW